MHAARRHTGLAASILSLRSIPLKVRLPVKSLPLLLHAARRVVGLAASLHNLVIPNSVNQPPNRSEGPCVWLIASCQLLIAELQLFCNTSGTKCSGVSACRACLS